MCYIDDLVECKEYLEKLDGDTIVKVTVGLRLIDARASEALKLIGKQIRTAKIEAEHKKTTDAIKLIDKEKQLLLRQLEFNTVLIKCEDCKLDTYEVSVEEETGPYTVLCDGDNVVAAYILVDGLTDELQRQYLEKEKLKDLSVAMNPVIKKYKEFKEKHGKNVESVSVTIDYYENYEVYICNNEVYSISGEEADKIVEALYGHKF